MARTCHLITNVRVTESVDEQPHVSAHWQVHVYAPEKQQSFKYYGFYEYVVRPEQDGYRIAKKRSFSSMT